MQIDVPGLAVTYDDYGPHVAVERSDDTLVLRLSGDLNEKTRLHELIDTQLRQALRGTVHIDLHAIEFINSAGLRSWIRFVQSLTQQQARAVVERCPEIMVRQMNMIRSARAGLAIASFYAPYVCSDCGGEALRLCDVQEGTPRLEAPACASCGGTMALDDDVASYTQFLRE
jgi:anti-anti-sigma factor